MKNILTIILLFLATLGIAQTHEYKYDAMGNRIMRTYSSNLTGTPDSTIKVASRGEEEETAINNETESFLTAKIYPNPTDGLLRFEIVGDLPRSGILTVFSLDGKAILRQRVTGHDIPIDLRNEAAGKYLIHLQHEQGVQTWKVAKL